MVTEGAGRQSPPATLWEAHAEGGESKLSRDLASGDLSLLSARLVRSDRRHEALVVDSRDREWESSGVAHVLGWGCGDLH